MADRRNGMPRAGDVLTAVLQRIDPEQQLRIYRIWTFWDDEVGDTIARRAQPAGFRNGILFVEVATHTWMQELQFLKETIRERLNTRLGSPLVRDIYFVSGHVAAAVETAPARDIHPGLRGDAEVSLPPIADRELAAVFARIVTARRKRIAAARPPRPRPRRRPGH